LVKSHPKVVQKLRTEQMTMSNFKSFLLYLQTWPDFTNKFLIAYENFLSVDQLDFENFDGKKHNISSNFA
jgi:hypothetical protein